MTEVAGTARDRCRLSPFPPLRPPLSLPLASWFQVRKNAIDLPPCLKERHDFSYEVSFSLLQMDIEHEDTGLARPTHVSPSRLTSCIVGVCYNFEILDEKTKYISILRLRTE